MTDDSFKKISDQAAAGVVRDKSKPAATTSGDTWVGPRRRTTPSYRSQGSLPISTGGTSRPSVARHGEVLKVGDSVIAQSDLGYVWTGDRGTVVRLHQQKSGDVSVEVWWMPLQRTEWTDARYLKKVPWKGRDVEYESPKLETKGAAGDTSVVTDEELGRVVDRCEVAVGQVLDQHGLCLAHIPEWRTGLRTLLSENISDAMRRRQAGKSTVNVPVKAHSTSSQEND